MIGVTKDLDRRALIIGTVAGQGMEIQRKMTKRELKKSLTRRSPSVLNSGGLMEKLGQGIKSKITAVHDMDPSKGPNL